MKHSTIAILALLALLIGSNVWWASRTLYEGAGLTCIAVSLEDSEQALEQTIAIIPLLAEQRSTKEEIVEHFTSTFGIDDGFEKDGVYWMGRIGLSFDETGQLNSVQRAWQ